ncbi:geranyl transferase [Idiomarina tyrosinivorans]|uniref:Geranyl transferase n=1 Tax=Idiomarina tyrosinivorans TaxID=1445662 RepID=A0A432ZSD5_9GAMM|nr:farnesyl diphosphate synthase [Idiomarina tyrosinivorans]RUO80772.1 geranyl transferase [Idiomarina tyrosinivorans]
MTVNDLTANVRQQLDAFLQDYLRRRPATAQLQKAMQHGLLLGGKRVRPYLTMSVAEACQGAADDALRAAAAVEAIHAYSLIHDDLPAMDDDDLRRGQPTCHKAFDEATAILAGDALQTLAFELLSDSQHGWQVSATQQLQMVQALASASGDLGMCGGQALDLAATGQVIDEAALAQLHRKKTGALIRAAVQLGVLCGTEDVQQYREAFDQFADALGLGFQVQDDVLDVTASTEVLGKPQGSDLAADKATYVKLLGLSGAQQRIQDLHQKALHSLAAIPYNTDRLEQLANVLLNRDH